MKLFFMLFLQTKTCILFVASGEGRLWKHFTVPCDSENPLSFISSFARLVSRLTQSSGWNTYLVCSASVLFSKIETACLTPYDVRSVEHHVNTLGQLLGRSLCLAFMIAN